MSKSAIYISLFIITLLNALSPAYAASTPLAPLPIADGAINAIHDQDGRLYLGGQFSSIDGSFVRNGLAAVDQSTGEVVANWAPSLGLGGIANVLLPSANGKVLYVGGQFAEAGGQMRGLLAAIDIDTASDTYGQVLDWNPGLVGAQVLALGYSTDHRTLYIGGEFSQVGAVMRQNLAAVDVNTGQVLPWAPDPDGPVHDVVVVPATSQVIAAGGFSHIGSIDGRDLRHAMALLNPANGAVIADWDAAITGAAVYDIALASDGVGLVVAGAFSNIGGQVRNNLARLELITAIADGSWQADTNGAVSQVLPTSVGQLFVAGEFTTIAATSRSYMALLEGSDGQLLPWMPSIALSSGMASVQALAISADSTRLSLAGDFTDIGGDGLYQYVAGFLITPPVTSTDPAASASPLPITVTLGCVDQIANPCAATYYSLDGSVPTLASPVYSLPLVMTSTTTVNYFSVDVDGNREGVHSDRYVIDQDPPQVTVLPNLAMLNASTYGPIELLCDDGGQGSGCATIHYTLDGSAATDNAPQYNGPIELADGETVLHYLAVDQAGNVGIAAEHRYTVDRDTPIISLSHDSGDYNPPLTITLTCDDGGGTGCGELLMTTDGRNPADSTNNPLTVNYVEPLELTFTSAAVLRVVVKDLAGNEGSSIVGIYSFTEAVPIKQQGSGALHLLWLCLAVVSAYRYRRYIRPNDENGACR